MMIAVALVLFTLLCLALGRTRSWSDETQAERNSLVFQSRNQAYGAYRLRTDYDRRMGVAFLATLGVLGLAVAIPKAIAYFSPATISIPKEKVIVTKVLDRVFEVPDAAPKPGPVKPAAALPLVKKDPDEQRLVEVTDSVVDPLPPRDTTSMAAKAPGTGIGTGTDPGTVDPGGTGGFGPSGSVGGTGKLTFDGFQVQELPQFPGGEDAMQRWVKRNLEFPEAALGKDVVYVQFVIGLDGSVEEVRAVIGKQNALKEAAERTIRRMPRWKPARMNGNDVKCRLTLPIRFETR